MSARMTSATPICAPISAQFRSANTAMGSSRGAFGCPGVKHRKRRVHPRAAKRNPRFNHPRCARDGRLALDRNARYINAVQVFSHRGISMQAALDQDFLFLLYDVARTMRTRADQRARARGMTRAQWVILARLERQPGLTQNELASIVEVEPITIARLVDRLEARELVVRKADPRDRRVWRLHLTPAAVPILREIAKYRAELHDLITAGMTPSLQKA